MDYTSLLRNAGDKKSRVGIIVCLETPETKSRASA